ncbi:hypothetical protein VOLCADRAFT_89394 [Volvox carteri f. nagariensis]|uniref:SRCR domain-containing protein n=1 Tax=Volvox carteri f. nagariensis TaxID=3068 RepID=D8TRK6_VOLCA|nr:uncharacterized protein VOLCADRAFT_89394 [Volvox carteri f. nagariensis]EFJ49909.1 hypothetical protein VOLCADRAFT_89394 [Volvox carteri f. nagariensis]|eukprot:XP_002948974.1 hypothetical protein VOLCADRAFT_89394 [Volvox carteri f. nagariensis]
MYAAKRCNELALRSMLKLLFLAAVLNGVIQGQARRAPRSPHSPSPPSSPPAPPDYSRKGLRLVRTVLQPRASSTAGGRNGRGGHEVVTGRLEVRVGSRQPRGSRPRWAPLCDDGSFDIWQAQEFCNIMGYKYGIKYNGSGISSYGPDENSCSSEPWHGRPATWLGFIDFPSRMAKYCYLFWSDCPAKLLVALQCSDSPLMASPLPPRAPSPPPPNAALRKAIRYVPPEPNLGMQVMFGMTFRWELLVNVSTSDIAGSVEGDGRGSDGEQQSSKDTAAPEAVWAPLCASPGQVAALRRQPRDSYGDAADIVANTSCYQVDDFTSGLFLSLTGYALAPVAIPKGNSNYNSTDSSSLYYYDSVKDGFDPSKYSHWVTIVDDGIRADRQALQEMQLNISTTPCESGYLFISRCDLIVTT